MTISRLIVVFMLFVFGSAVHAAQPLNAATLAKIDNATLNATQKGDILGLEPYLAPDFQAAIQVPNEHGQFQTLQFSREEFLEFGKVYDLQVLEALLGKSRVTMLHICGNELMFDLVADYPVHVLNWAASSSGATLADARRLTGKPLAGGLSLSTLLSGTTCVPYN